MALIKCPNCGETISDQAEICPKCGNALKKEIKKCLECGEVLPENAMNCPYCGCPVELKEEKKHRKLNLKIVISVIVIIIALIVAVVTMSNIQQKKKAAEEAEQAKKEQEMLADYQTNLTSAVVTMFEGSGTAENAGSLIHDVWYDAIYGNYYETNTTKYVKGCSDFNDALSKLFSDSEFQTKISNIKDNQDTVMGLMKNLQNPPEEYKEAYANVKELYDAYVELTNLVVNPTGSLSSYTETYNSADSNLANKFEAIQMYIN